MSGLFFCRGNAIAGGPVHGARAAGMNTAFVGIADDASSILHNPAGLTQTDGTEIYLGLTGITISSTYESPGGENERTKDTIYFAPHFFLSSDFGTEELVFGLGMYSPFGVGGREWDRSGTTRYIATKSVIATYSVNPTVAWEILPGISVAAGIDYVRARMEMERMIDQSFSGAGDGRTNIEAEGDGWSYNIGLHIVPHKSLRIGLAYRSSVEVDYKGKMTIRKIAPAMQPFFGSSRYTSDVTTSTTFPEIYSFGVAYNITDDLVVDGDLEWVRWSSFDAMKLDIEDEVPKAGVTDSSVKLDWKDALQCKIGTEYQATRAFRIRSGYAYIPTPVPERTLGPDNPDSDQHNFSVGAGYNVSSFTVDVFYNIGILEKRRVNNDILDGKYESYIHYYGMSLGYAF